MLKYIYLRFEDELNHKIVYVSGYPKQLRFLYLKFCMRIVLLSNILIYIYLGHETIVI